MTRWIAFDPKTAAQVRSQLPQQDVFEAPGRNALEYALETPRTVVTVLPPVSGRSIIAVFRPPRPAAPIMEAEAEPEPEPARLELITDKPARVRATGFLGLQDEVFSFDDEESTTKKSWWRRLWE